MVASPTQTKAWIDLGDRLIPVELSLVDQFGQEEGGHALSVRRHHEQRVGVHWRGLAELAHADATLEDHLAMIDERDGSPRHS